ncbi:MAG: hypothetical protein HRU35_03255 [Rickettsiaceae bacterium]|nr:hypothetical protein [Rickettsiaceae bacterium]
MLLNEEKITFIDQILKLLEPMGEIVISESQNTKYLSKDRITFAKIAGNQLYLRAPDVCGYTLVYEETLQNSDQFLKRVRNAYFFAQEQELKISGSI